MRFSRPLSHSALLLFFVIFQVSSVLQGTQTPPEFAVGELSPDEDGIIRHPSTVQDPYFRLAWVLEPEEPVQFRLEQSNTSDFGAPILRYEGSDKATFLAGLSEGDYYFRIQAFTEETESEWSTPFHITVRYHDQWLALTLFSVGAIVFLSTVALIIRGAIKVS